MTQTLNLNQIPQDGNYQPKDPEISKDEQISLMKEMVAEAERILNNAPKKEGSTPLFSRESLEKFSKA